MKRKLKIILAGAVALVLTGTILWQTGMIQESVLRSTRAKDIIEKFARRTLDSRSRKLGRLGYYASGTWTPFSQRQLKKRTWREGQNFLYPHVDFHAVAEGLRLGTLSVKHENGLRFDVIFLEIDPAHIQVRVLVNDGEAKQATYVKNTVKAHGALAGVNAGFFDANGAIGLVLRAGRRLRPANANPGYFVVRNGQPGIRVQRNLRLSGFEEGIQCSPVLVRDGQVYRYVSEGKNATEVARRSAVAITYQNKVLLLTTDVRLSGLTIHQLTTLLVGLGAQDALALDGGGSTQLYVSHDGFEKDIAGWDPVPVALGLFPTP